MLSFTKLRELSPVPKIMTLVADKIITGQQGLCLVLFNDSWFQRGYQTVSLVITDDHFNLPQGFVCICKS